MNNSYIFFYNASIRVYRAQNTRSRIWPKHPTLVLQLLYIQNIPVQKVLVQYLLDVSIRVKGTLGNCNRWYCRFLCDLTHLKPNLDLAEKLYFRNPILNIAALWTLTSNLIKNLSKLNEFAEIRLSVDKMMKFIFEKLKTL